jgi:hypothetical protein
MDYSLFNMVTVIMDTDEQPGATPSGFHLSIFAGLLYFLFFSVDGHQPHMPSYALVLLGKNLLDGVETEAT